MNKSESLLNIKGIGEKTFLLFNKQNIYTVEDLINFFPKTYKEYNSPVSYNELNDLYFYTIKGVILPGPIIRRGKKASLILAKFKTDDEVIILKWFNMPYLISTLPINKEIYVYGRINNDGRQLFISQPELYSKEQYARLENKYYPQYKSLKGLSNNYITKKIEYIFDNCDYYYDDALISYAKNIGIDVDGIDIIKNMHFPKDYETLKTVKQYFAFDELFRFLLNVKYLNKQEKVKSNIKCDFSVIDELIPKLDYTLTTDQQNAIRDIINDFDSQYIMNRLIEGDVGSGKTIVAFLIAIVLGLANYQTIFMAPTEILATQHFHNLKQLLSKLNLDINISLLLGSQNSKTKKEILNSIKENDSKIIIGTSALIQEKVQYNNPALVIIDEQHRFGVNQRETLIEKGLNLNVLMLSATPIPRTLALILYANMSLTMIKEKPSNRIPVKSYTIYRNKRRDLYNFVGEHIKNNEQCFIVCPLIDEGEIEAGENVKDYVEKLKTFYDGKVKVAMLHGRMKQDEKEKVMNDFLARKYDILVSTTVIEVGIDIPNATIMIIENAECFGLSTLHQLRGRVGRSNKESFCFFINGRNKENERLKAITANNDGFDVAKEDLNLRGPGDFLGIKQSGDIEFEFADIYRDVNMINSINDMIDKIIEADPNLTNDNNRILRDILEENKRVVL